MDLLKPGLPNRVLHQVRTTNTISAKLVQQLKHLHDQTNLYLLSVSTTGVIEDVASGSLEDIFSKFYYAVGLDKAKTTQIPEISMGSLKRYHEQMEKASNGSETHRALIQVVNRYLVLISVYHLANLIIYKTIVSKSQLRYWSDLKVSSYAKIVYGVQTLPIRIYRFASAGIHNTVLTALDESRLKLVPSALWRSFSQIAGQMVSHANANFIIRSSKLRMVQMPLNYITDEVKLNLRTVYGHLDDYYEKLGVIINNLPVQPDLIPKLLGCEPEVASILDAVANYVNDQSDSAKCAPPNFITRNWPILLVLANYGPSTTTRAWTNRYEILEWVKHNLVDTFAGFWNNWIVKPIGDMLKILRDDETMTITSKESLRSDLESLDRMVVDFMRDNNVSVDPEQVHQAVSQGDLTMMMSQYEKELKTPYKLILKGLLIRSILIQVQKTKVDGAVAINGIDKLLKSQQLLFGVLLISPSLFILYQANRFFHKDQSMSPNVAGRRIDGLKSMNQVEKLVNRETVDDKLVRDGKLFVEIVNLNLLSRDIVPKKLQGDFLHDLNELAVSSTESSERASSAVNRIWNMYLPFFRKAL